MKQGKLTLTTDGMLLFYCPGCKRYHGIYTDKDRPVHWDFNGNFEKPTFSPSILVKEGHYIDGHKGECWCDYNKKHPDDKAPYSCGICHSFVRDGKIQFLSDCTHELAGKIVDMEDED